MYHSLFHLSDLIPLLTRPFNQNTWSSFIYLFIYLFFAVHDHSTKKIRVFIYIFISFVHHHSTKIRGHSYSLLYSLLNCLYISCPTFIAVLIDFVQYIQGRTALIFRALYQWLYEVFAPKGGNVFKVFEKTLPISLHWFTAHINKMSRIPVKNHGKKTKRI